jgi:hypothetical protein
MQNDLLLSHGDGRCGCVVSSDAHATLVGPLPAYNGAYLLRIQQPVGVKFHPHAMVFGKTLYMHEVWLAYPPNSGRTTYSSREVRIQEMKSSGNLEELRPTSGTVIVDRITESVSVHIDISSKPFSGNGDYRLRIQ